VILATVQPSAKLGRAARIDRRGLSLEPAGRHPEHALLLPLHRNPTVREPLEALLGQPTRRASLTEPL